MTKLGALRRRVAAIFLAGVVATAVLVAPGSAAASEGPHSGRAVAALSGSQFVAGNIISDANFYNGRAMTQGEIQTFLDAKVGRCTNGKCLNVINVSLASQPAYVSDSTGRTACTALAAMSNVKVAALIYRVQVACGISAKVILVTLQKEQGLVTKTAPSDYALRFAMGMNCPDSSGCSAAAAGLAAQIYRGSRQLKIYRTSEYLRQPGYHTIAYHPNGSCGSKTIKLQNYATAALYNYTPYQPNGAALGNLYGTGDTCSSYGNRNFWRYYTDWFGSTQGSSSGWIDTGAGVFAVHTDGTLFHYAAASGKWKPRSTVGTGWTGLDQIIGMGDFNGDGHRDILALDAGATLWLYPSDGILAFGDRVQVATDWEYDLTASVGDMNSDKRPDLLVRAADASMNLLASDGLGGFRAPVKIGNGWHIYDQLVGPGDFSGDGKADVVARDTAGKLWLYRGTGTGAVTSRVQLGSGWNIYDELVAPGDYSGDKKADLLARTPSGVLYLYKGTGTSKVNSRVQVGSGWNVFSNLSGVGPGPGSKVVVPSGVGDLNSDGRRDVIARETSTGTVWLYRGKTATTWNGRVAIAVDWSEVRFAQGVGDFDGDGIGDMLVVTNDGTVTRYPSNRAGGFGAPIPVTTGWDIYDQVVSAGDFNSDLRPDVLARDAAGVLWLLAGTGSGFAAPVQVGSGWSTYRIISVGDWDGDRAGDVMAVDSAGALWLYPGDGDSGWFTRVKIGNGWTTIDAFGPGDFTADGRVDLFARDATGKLWLYPGNGSGGFSPRVQLGNGWGIFDLLV